MRPPRAWLLVGMALLPALLALGAATPTFAANLRKPGHMPKATHTSKAADTPPPVATAPPAPAPAPPTSAPAPNPGTATATRPATVAPKVPAAAPASVATPPPTPAPTPTAASIPTPAPKATAPVPANPAPTLAQNRRDAMDGPAGFELAAAVVGLLLFAAAGWLLLRGKGPRAATLGTADGSTGAEVAAFDARRALIPSLEPHFATVPVAPPPAVGRRWTEPIFEIAHHVTAAPAAAALRPFIEAWSGASVDADSDTYPDMALLRRYSEEVLGAPSLWVAPIEIPQSYSMDHFVWVQESPYQVPAPGDIVVWERSSEDASDGGRAAIFVRGDATGFDAFTVQGATAGVRHYADYRWVLGWLRPIRGVPPAS